MTLDERGLAPVAFYHAWQSADDAILLDIRTAGELARTPQLPGAAHLDYLDSGFEEQLRTFDPFVPYFLYGDGGDRSRRACAVMLSRGFLLVHWLDGAREDMRHVAAKLG